MVDVGDVMLVRTNGVAAAAIRLGAALMGRPNLVNHIAVVHHRDAKGNLFGIEGRPGGVGWVDMRLYLNSRWTRSNALQPKTREQRKAIAQAMESLLKTPYDWVDGIGRDVCEAIDPLYRPNPKWPTRGVPGHVVCSSAADWAYGHVHLDSPQHDQDCTPGDWDLFLRQHGWETTP